MYRRICGLSPPGNSLNDTPSLPSSGLRSTISSVSNMSFHPHTPQSPSQFSPSTTDPSTSMTSTTSSLGTTLPTPAHSVSGSSLPYPEMTHDDDTPQKRKRALEDIGDREQKKVHIEDRRLGIEDLHLDVGEKYLLCRTRKTPFISKAFCHYRDGRPCDLVPHGLSRGIFPGASLFQWFG